MAFILARMVRVVGLVALLAGATISAAEQARRLSTDYTCASDLGPGVGNARRRFCDVMITTTPSKSVSVPIPPHSGAATLLFDLHNRFTVLGAPAEPAQTYVRHTAIVAVVGPGGEELARTGVRREFRSIQDLFDRIAGGDGPTGVKLVAPGQPQAVRVAIPAGVSSVGIVGQRLEVMNRDGSVAHDAPDRPIAIVSNVRVEYSAK